MESSLACIESSLRKLELCPGAKLAIWPYGAIKVDKSNVAGSGNITKYIESCREMEKNIVSVSHSLLSG